MNRGYSLSEKRFQEIPVVKRTLFRQAQRNLVVAEAARNREPVELLKMKWSWVMYIMSVASIADNLLLDFVIVDEHDVNTRRGFEIRGKWTDCNVDQKHDKISNVLASETTTIPPSSEILGKSENY